MALILKLDLDMVKMQDHIKNEVSMSTQSIVISQTGTQTDGQTHRYTDMTKTLPLPQRQKVVIKKTHIT